MIRFKFIEDHRTEFSVKRMCTVLKVRRSSYYKWAANAARREQQVYADGLLGERIRIAFEAEGGLYGAKRIAALLTAQTPDQPVKPQTRSTGDESSRVGRFYEKTSCSHYCQ